MTSRLRVVFAGTPEFAVPHLDACRRDEVAVVAVYTQPDRPAGRGRKLTPSPVKAAALAAGISVEQPENFKDAAARSRLAAYSPDLIVVVAYGLILPRKVLAIPRRGCWNVHASLLPRWRGAAPIQRAVVAGDAHTGICLMHMEAGLDTGPVLIQRVIPVASDDTGGSLQDKLAALGAEVLGEGLERILHGESLVAHPQAEEGITYAHKLGKAEARLDWTQSALALERKIRAFDPWPIAEAELAGETLRIWHAQVCAPAPQDNEAQRPGTIVGAGRNGIDIACGEGVLRILKLQRAGARPVSAADYVNARPQLLADASDRHHQATPAE